MKDSQIEDSWKIPLYKIYSDEEDLNLIQKVIRRGNRWAIGPEIEEFEHEIQNYLGCNYCLTFNSGTSSLHATFLAYGLSSNDEIIVPSFSFIATANAVLFVNGIPKFADIEPDTYGLDPDSVSEKITPSTKAIVPMDYGGMSCKIFENKQVAKANKLLLIEDAAEGLGSSINGKKIGTISDAAIFSFCGNKVLTTGEGGAVVTNSREIYEKLKLLRSHGRVDKINYFENPEESEYVGIGYNWRMSTLTASLGISQIMKLDKIIKMRQDNAKYLSSRLEKYDEIEIPKPPLGYEHIYQMYTIKLRNKKIRDSLQRYLRNKKIFSKVYFEPIHLKSFYKKNFGTTEGLLPVTEELSKRVLTIPLYPNMTNEEKKYLVESISEFLE